MAFWRNYYQHWKGGEADDRPLLMPQWDPYRGGWVEWDTAHGLPQQDLHPTKIKRVWEELPID